MAMDQSIVVATFTQTTCRMNKRSIANWWKAEIQRWCKDLGRQHLRGSTAAWERRPKTRRRRELTLRQTYAEENSAFKNRRTPLRLIACLLARRPGNAERWLRSTQVNAAGAWLPFWAADGRLSGPLLTQMPINTSKLLKRKLKDGFFGSFPLHCGVTMANDGIFAGTF